MRNIFNDVDNSNIYSSHSNPQTENKFNNSLKETEKKQHVTMLRANIHKSPIHKQNQFLTRINSFFDMELQKIPYYQEKNSEAQCKS